MSLACAWCPIIGCQEHLGAGLEQAHHLLAGMLHLSWCGLRTASMESLVMPNRSLLTIAWLPAEWARYRHRPDCSQGRQLGCHTALARLLLQVLQVLLAFGTAWEPLAMSRPGSWGSSTASRQGFSSSHHSAGFRMNPPYTCRALGCRIELAGNLGGHHSTGARLSTGCHVISRHRLNNTTDDCAPNSPAHYTQPFLRHSTWKRQQQPGECWRGHRRPEGSTCRTLTASVRVSRQEGLNLRR